MATMSIQDQMQSGIRLHNYPDEGAANQLENDSKVNINANPIDHSADTDEMYNNDHHQTDRSVSRSDTDEMYNNDHHQNEGGDGTTSTPNPNYPVGLNRRAHVNPHNVNPHNRQVNINIDPNDQSRSEASTVFS